MYISSSSEKSHVPDILFSSSLCRRFNSSSNSQLPPNPHLYNPLLLNLDSIPLHSLTLTRVNWTLSISWVRWVRWFLPCRWVLNTPFRVTSCVTRALFPLIRDLKAIWVTSRPLWTQLLWNTNYGNFEMKWSSWFPWAIRGVWESCIDTKGSDKFTEALIKFNSKIV